MKKITDWRLTTLFPKHCAYCDRFIFADELMCDYCKKNLPRITGEICRSCGREKKTCTCKKSSNYFTAIAAPFYFEGNVRNGIHRYKFRKAKTGADAFAFEMANTISKEFAEVRFDYITEVPISKESLLKRGYNQCSVLAEIISKRTGIVHKPDVLKKIYETDNQHGMNYYMRRGNLTGVFECDNPDDVKDKTILLCDDISTSGETLNECAKMLWLYDAKAVYCITTALTKKQGDK